MKQTFEEFLEDRYDEIDNDSNNCNEEFEGRRDTWFAELDADDLIKYADMYGKLAFVEGKVAGAKEVDNIIQDKNKEYQDFLMN
jgi:hypothetical protein